MSFIDPATATAVRCYPSISLLLPVDGSQPWRTRLARLGRHAEGRLRAEFGDHVDSELLARLRHAVSTSTPPPGAKSMCVFLNAHTMATIGLDGSVRERTVIDDTFATRDLVADELRAPTYWVVALTLEDPRLFQGQGDRLHAVRIELPEVRGGHSPRDRRRGNDRSDALDAVRSRRSRALDDALDAALRGNQDPIVVVGAEPTLSRFLATTRHVGRIESTVRKAPDRDLTALSARVAPAVAEMLAERRVRALSTLAKAVDAGTAASGIEPVWRAARRGSGLLVVEATYEQAVRVIPGSSITTELDPEQPGVIDDGVDEIIESVLAKSGRVEVVPDGMLAEHQRIAFVPTSQRRPPTPSLRQGAPPLARPAGR